MVTFWFLVGSSVVLALLTAFVLIIANDNRHHGLRDQMWIEYGFALVCTVLVALCLTGAYGILHWGWLA